MGVSAQKLEIYQESVEGKTQKMTAAFEKFSTTMLDSGLIGGLADMGSIAFHALSAFDGVPAKIADVASIMGKQSKSIGPIRAQLISKGLIYSTRHGEIDYTVPQFSKYLKRFHPDYFDLDGARNKN